MNLTICGAFINHFCISFSVFELWLRCQYFFGRALYRTSELSLAVLLAHSRNGAFFFFFSKELNFVAIITVDIAKNAFLNVFNFHNLPCVKILKTTQVTFICKKYDF